jgi:glycosyltransferase involved in cell wall biosynthesis
MAEPELSVVLPIHDEADNLEPLHRELTLALEGLSLGFEVIAVDDGSGDASLARLKDIQAADPRWTVVALRRNFGQTAAFSAGFGLARGRVIVAMDADLQNDPQDIGRLLALIDQGCDIASGWRQDRKEPLLTRRLPSKLANWLISRATGVRLHDYGCSLKAYRREVLEKVHLYGDLHRFIPAVAAWQGVRLGEAAVADRPRRHGRSHYGLARTFRVLLDLLLVAFFLGFQARPFRLFGGVGLALSLLGGLVALLLTGEKLFLGHDIGGRPLLLLAVLLIIVGVQVMGLGLVAELLTRSYFEGTGQRPYVIREIVRAAGEPERPR